MAWPRDLCSPARGPVSSSPAVTGPSLAPSPRGRDEPLGPSDQRAPRALGPEGWSGARLLAAACAGDQGALAPAHSRGPRLSGQLLLCTPGWPSSVVLQQGTPSPPRKARVPVLQTKGRLPEARKEPLSADPPSLPRSHPRIRTPAPADVVSPAPSLRGRGWGLCRLGSHRSQAGCLCLGFPV